MLTSLSLMYFNNKNTFSLETVLFIKRNDAYGQFRDDDDICKMMLFV